MVFGEMAFRQPGHSQDKTSVTDPTNPVNSSVQVTVSLDRDGLAVLLWSQNVMQTAVSKNVAECLQKHLPGTKGDAVAISLVLAKIPEEWQHEAAEKGSAFRAFSWLKEKFTGGVNLEVNEEWQEQLEKEPMAATQTLEQYLSKKKLLAARINGNGGYITQAKLKRCVINNLPWCFENHKAALTASTATATMDEMLSIMRSMAKKIGYDDKTPSRRGPAWPGEGTVDSRQQLEAVLQEELAGIAGRWDTCEHNVPSC